MYNIMDIIRGMMMLNILKGDNIIITRACARPREITEKNCRDAIKN